MPRDVVELAGSLAFLDDLQDQFVERPADVDASWHPLLNGPANGQLQTNGAPSRNGDVSKTHRTPAFARPGAVTMSPITAQPVTSVWPLVNAYRTRGHFLANLDPLGLLETAHIPELDPETWGYGERDRD